MAVATARRYPSPVEGKEQNCSAFGTFEPASSTAKFAAVCHGGYYDNAYYEPCPVKNECKAALMAKNNMRVLPQINGTPSAQPTLTKTAPAPQEAPRARTSEELFKARLFKPDYGNLRRTLPLVQALDAAGTSQVTQVPAAAPTRVAPAASVAPPVQGTVAPKPAAAVSAPQAAPTTAAPQGPTLHGAAGGIPQVVVPAPSAPSGTRTPYAAPTAFSGDFFPTYMPDEDESVWSRLFKNMFQGILAAIGWAIWNYCRTVDLFA